MTRPDKHGWPHEPDGHEYPDQFKADPFSLPRRLEAFARRWWPFAWRFLAMATLLAAFFSALWVIAVAQGEVHR